MFEEKRLDERSPLGIMTYMGQGLLKIASAVVLSGASKGAVSAGRAATRSEARRLQRWDCSSAAWLRAADAALRRSEPGDAAWHSKVEELAGRGITLQALLTFYRGLGSEYMRHYSPSRHRTVDVVREAIVPLSSSNRSALASIVMQGRHTRPDKMVTHTWSSLFRDLVAAIVADALEEEEYGMIALLLESDIGTLERWVAKTKAGLRVYWVCAFSVDQHRGICAGNPARTKDTVTGELHQTCSCGAPKAWNDTEPLRGDGASIPCEMNKFHDMMRHLSAADVGFEQVVAVDADFVLFSRAWCVAELAAAADAGMPQRLKLESAGGLARHEERLRTLRIQDLEASRPEDREEILRGIPDADAFNEHLQRLLFADLFPRWRNLDAGEQMARVGRVLRWSRPRTAP